MTTFRGAGDGWTDGWNHLSRTHTYTTVIGANETLTGPAWDCRMFASVMTTVDTDQDGSLQMQFSVDGTNWDRSKTIAVDQAVGSGSPHGLAIITPFFRIVYTNGSVAQTHFRLSVLFHISRQPYLASTPDEIISRINDAQIVRVANNVTLDLSRGLYADKYTVHKFGANADVGTGAFEDIWYTGGTYPWPTGAETVRARAGNAADDNAGGAGARKVMVEGLDENWALASEEITLAGESASGATTTTFIRVFRAYVTDAGTYTGANTANVVIENTTATNILCTIPAGVGQSEMAIYTIPAGYKAYLVRAVLEVEGSKPAEVRIFWRPSADTTSAPVQSKRIIHDTLALEGVEEINFTSYPELTEKSDIWVDALASSGGGATQVDAAFDLVCIADTSLVTPQ